MNKGQRITIWIICAVSLVLSVAAVCMAYYHTPDLGFDYQGMIVGVLSLLVTVLVGWNIWSLIDFKRKEIELNKNISLAVQAIENMNKAQLGNNVTTESSIAFVYYSLMGLKDPLGLDFRYLQHSLLALCHASVLGDFLTCSTMVKALLEVVTRPENITMSKKNKDNLYLWMGKIKSPDKIDRFNELVETIVKIKTI